MIIRLLIGAVIGALAGAALGYFGKCSSGACPLTANPFRGAIYGAVLGMLFAVASGYGKGENDKALVQPQPAPQMEQPKDAKETAAQETLIHINNAADFERQVLKAELPCLVDFFSLGCPPCRMLSPTIEKLAEKYKGRAVFCKLSLDHAGTQGLAQRYGISSIPTVIFFDKGKEVDRLVGLRNEEAYSKILDELIETKKQTAKEK
jgi:thioredoxin 1